MSDPLVRPSICLASVRRQPRSIRWKFFKSSFEIEWPDDDYDQRVDP